MDLINYRLCTHIINRECRRLPWGFPGQPTPVPASTGMGFMGMGGGFTCLDPWTARSLHTRLVDVGCQRGIVGVGVSRWGQGGVCGVRGGVGGGVVGVEGAGVWVVAMCMGNGKGSGGGGDNINLE